MTGLLKIATFNVYGVNGRLPVLLSWLSETEPDVVCLQELKAPSERFPEEALAQAGYGAVWLGQSRWNGVAILARDAEPIVTRRSLPGDADDMQSRYLEAAVRGLLIGCLYLPNGNPALEWAPRAGQDQAAVLTGDWGFWSSNWFGLR